VTFSGSTDTQVNPGLYRLEAEHAARALEVAQRNVRDRERDLERKLGYPHGARLGYNGGYVTLSVKNRAETVTVDIEVRGSVEHQRNLGLAKRVRVTVGIHDNSGYRYRPNLPSMAELAEQGIDGADPIHEDGDPRLFGYEVDAHLGPQVADWLARSVRTGTWIPA